MLVAFRFWGCVVCVLHFKLGIEIYGGLMLSLLKFLFLLLLREVDASIMLIKGWSTT